MEKTVLILATLILSCKGQNEENKFKDKKESYNFEVEDSDEAHIMDDWSTDKKNYYYTKVSELMLSDLKRYKINIPNNIIYKKNIQENLNIKIKEKEFQILPYNLLEIDSLQDNPQIILFNNANVVAFNNSLPLINKSSIEYYKTEDYLNLDNSNSAEVLLNKILFNHNLKELKKNSEYEFVVNYLVYSFHYTKDSEFLNAKIKKTITENEYELVYKPNELLHLLFFRDRYEIDKAFLKQIIKIDDKNILLKRFIEALQKYKLNLKGVEIDKLIAEIKELYGSNTNQQINKKNVTTYDLNNDKIKDSIIVDDNDVSYILLSNKKSLLTFKNDKLFKVTAQCPSDSFSKIVTKNQFVTFEKYSCNNEYYIYSYITFKVNNNQIFLDSYSEEYTDRDDSEKDIPIKIWNKKDFGEIKFEETSEDFIINLKQNRPRN